jgi:hypothetical protein
MADEFTNNVAQKFPNTQSKESVERPWDVTEPGGVTPVKSMDEGKNGDVAERINDLYSELRDSLTVRSAVDIDLRRAYRTLQELNRVKAEVEKIIEMLRAMEVCMRGTIK